MREFWRFMGDVESVQAWLAKAAVGAPFIVLFLGIGPPWPAKGLAATCAALIELLVMACAFEFWSEQRKAPGRKHLRRAASLSVVMLITYIALHAFFIYSPPDLDPKYQECGQECRGLVYQERIRLLLQHPGATQGKLLAKASFNPLEIWEPWSVYLMRTIILLVWLGFFASLSSSIAAFVVLQRRRSRSARVERRRGANNRKKATAVNG